MFGPFERAVAGRYLRARRGERFVSIIAIFSLVGIALGVATLIIVTSVMGGFQVDLLSRILGFNGTSPSSVYGAGEPARQLRRRCRHGSATSRTSSRRLPVLDGQVLLSTERRAVARRLRARHHARPICVAAPGQRPYPGRQAGRLHRATMRSPIGVGLARRFALRYRLATDADLAAGRGDGVRHGAARARLQGRGDLRGRAERLRQRLRVPAAGGGAGLFQKPDAVTAASSMRRPTPTTSTRRAPRDLRGAGGPPGADASTGTQSNNTFFGAVQVRTERHVPDPDADRPGRRVQRDLAR